MGNPDYPAGERGDFVDQPGRSFTLPSRYYFDAAIYQRELTRIFHRSWCYLGHASQLPNPGDYRVDKIADQCVFLVRIDAATIKAFFNVCQHRGHELLSGEGNLKKRIVCPYHAWTYNLDGSLFRAPHTDRLESFQPKAFGLKEIRLANCAGLLFANLESTSASFYDTYAGLDTTFADNLPSFKDFALCHQLHYQIAANWKVVVDNFSEGYHIPVAHKLLARVLDSAANNESLLEARFSFFKSRSKSGYAGLELAAGEPYLSWTLWPNTCMLSQPGSENLIVIRMAPHGPTTCLERVDILTPGGASSTNLEAVKSLFSENFNLEDIAIVESVQRGLQSLGYDQGRYVIDDQDAWYSESGLHRFHLQILEALNEDP